MAALVSSIDLDATVVELINLSGTAARSLIVQAGALAEDDIVSVGYEIASPDCPAATPNTFRTRLSARV